MRYISARSGAFVVIVGALGLTPWLRAQPPAVNALSQHYDRTRVGATLVETVLTTTTVGSGKFGKLWTLYADGQVVAQPLYVSGLRINTTGNPNTPLVQGTFNARDRRDDAQHRLRVRRRREQRRPRRPDRAALGHVARPAAPRRQRHRHVEHQRSRVGHPRDAGRERRTSPHCTSSRGTTMGRRASATSCTRSTCRTARTGSRPS